MNITVDEESYRQELAKALPVPRYMTTFRQLYLNQWVAGATNWIGLDDWKKCAGPAVALESLKGKRATLGIDLR